MINKKVKLFLKKLEEEEKEFNRKYPTQKDKLIYWILNSINVNGIEKEELETWKEEELNDYLGMCEMIADERQMLEEGLHWSQNL